MTDNSDPDDKDGLCDIEDSAAGITDPVDWSDVEESADPPAFDDTSAPAPSSYGGISDDPGAGSFNDTSAPAPSGYGDISDDPGAGSFNDTSAPASAVDDVDSLDDSDAKSVFDVLRGIFRDSKSDDD